MNKLTIALIVVVTGFGLFVSGFVVPYYRLHKDEYVEKKILEALNLEFDEVNFTHVIVYDVLNLETDGIFRRSWHTERTTSKYIRPFLAYDQEILNWDNPNEGDVNTTKGFIDLNGNVFFFGLNLW